MKKYEKPVLVLNEDLAEGVYAASGAVDCYTVSAEITQTPQEGRANYVIQVNANHNPIDEHHSTMRIIVIVFNQSVQYQSSDASGYAGDGSNVLTLTYNNSNGSHHNNAIENIGLGNLIVTSEAGLSIERAYSTYCNRDCAQH